MILINTGIPKSGTSLLLDYQRALIRRHSARNGLDEIARRRDGSFFADLDDAACQELVEVEREYGPLVIKTHSKPTSALRNLLAQTGVFVTCSCRDPRDVVLSALDHGKRTRAGEHSKPAFAEFHTVAAAAEAASGWMEIDREWRESGLARMIRYECLLAQPREVLRAMAEACGLAVRPDALDRIIARRRSSPRQGWNFNKGTGTRWSEEMSADALSICEEWLATEIARMGYGARGG